MPMALADYTTSNLSGVVWSPFPLHTNPSSGSMTLNYQFAKTTFRQDSRRCCGWRIPNWADFARFLSDPIFPLQEYERDQLSRRISNNCVLWAASPPSQP